jgi:hypothetical protein
MRAQTKSPAHANVSWEYRNNNVHFWDDDEIAKFSIRPRATAAKNRDDEQREIVDIGHVESQMMNISEALLTHNERHAKSWLLLSNMWQWINEMSEKCPSEKVGDMIQPPGTTPVLITSEYHHLALADISLRWKTVRPVLRDVVSTTTAPTGPFCPHLPRQAHTTLRQDQQRVFDHIASPDQTLTFVLGPGGVGKTVMINALNRHFGEDGQLNFAYTGVAAALLPNGRTLTGLFGAMHNNTMKDLTSLAEHAKHIVIDEISMCPMHMVIHMDARLRIVTGVNLPFGGMSITLVGDLMQLPVITKAGKNIFDEHAWPPGFGALLELFEYFTDNDFDGNQRSDGCMELEALTTAMRQLPNFMPGGEVLKPGVKTWSEEELSLFQPLNQTTVNAITTELTGEELAGGFSNFPCHLFCRTNKAKSAYNLKLMERMSKARGVPVYIFKRPILHHSQLEACKGLLYDWDRFPELFTVFMKGAPGVILCNENVELGLVNGATGTMHGIRWDDAEDNIKWSKKMLDATPGQVFLVGTPDQIFLKLDPHKDHDFWQERLQRFPIERNICPPERRANKTAPFVKKNIIVGLGYCKTQPEWAKAKFGQEAFHFKPHNVEPSLAVTPWKSQGRAYKRAVFDSSNAFGATQMSLELLYVAFTRVTNLRSIRMLPSKTMEAFRKALLILRSDFLATRFRCRAERKAIARRLREAAASLDVPMSANAGNGRSCDPDRMRSGSVTRARSRATAAPAGLFLENVTRYRSPAERA